MRQKETYFLMLSSGNRTGVGECGIFRGLSCDDRPDYEERLQWVCDHINDEKGHLITSLVEFPSIQFGIEQALMSLDAEDNFTLFPSDFTKGKDHILINGLIWMGKESFMKEQIAKKLDEGFTTLKMKIGAIDFKTEMNILSSVRKQFSASELELRVDANGAFSKQEALVKLEQLAALDIHSIEQPVRAGQWEVMADLCEKSPVDIALDEELIGVFGKEQKVSLLDRIKPKYIILKPSLTGGIQGCREWITAAEKQGISWWITSALESNIGLNAIAQFTYTLKNNLPQGLGTGSLFSNNAGSPLFVENGALHLNPEGKWDDLRNFLGDNIIFGKI